VGSTFIRVVERYARSLQAQDNLLLLAGINARVLEQLQNTALLDIIGEENVFPVKARFGASTEQALARAKVWQTQYQEMESP